MYKINYDQLINHYCFTCKITKYFGNNILLIGTFLQENSFPLVETILHDDSSLLLPNYSHKSIDYDINNDAKNVQLPGTMWGMHCDVK